MIKLTKGSLYKFLTLTLVLVNIILLIVIFSMYFDSNKNTTDNNNINDTNNNLNNDKMDNQKTNTNNPIVLFETSQGNFKAELFLEESPITAGNFKKLVEEGFYNGIKFHRVIPNFMIQGGDPLSKNDSLKNRWGMGGSEPIEDEFIKGLSNTRGTLSMANAGPNTGSSQFFINVADNTFLDWDKQPSQSKHPVFGKIIEGMDIVDKISTVQTGQADRPVENVIIIKASIIEE